MMHRPRLPRPPLKISLALARRAGEYMGDTPTRRDPMPRAHPNPVFVAVRRLRFGFLARAAAGDMSEGVCKERLCALASFAQVSGLDSEALEILEDAGALAAEGETWTLRAF